MKISAIITSLLLVVTSVTAITPTDVMADLQSLATVIPDLLDLINSTSTGPPDALPSTIINIDQDVQNFVAQLNTSSSHVTALAVVSDTVALTFRSAYLNIVNGFIAVANALVTNHGAIAAGDPGDIGVILSDILLLNRTIPAYGLAFCAEISLTVINESIGIIIPFLNAYSAAIAAYSPPVIVNTAIGNDISGIVSKTQTLDSNIKAITTTNIAGALALHTALGTLVTSFNTATTDANAASPKPLSEATGTDLLSRLRILEPVLISALNDLVAKKATIAAIPITGLSALILQDLKSLNTAMTAFINALDLTLASDIRSASAPVVSAINSALSSAITAFS